jgi:hypothetical protein
MCGIEDDDAVTAWTWEPSHATPKMVGPQRRVLPFLGVGRPFQAVFSGGFLTAWKGRPTKNADSRTQKRKSPKTRLGVRDNLFGGDFGVA